MPEETEVYSDAVQIGMVAPWTVVITFMLQPANPATGQSPKTLVTVRMSPEHTKIFAMMLRRNLKAYEEQTGTPINIPAEVYRRLGIPQEDW